MYDKIIVFSRAVSQERIGLSSHFSIGMYVGMDVCKLSQRHPHPYIGFYFVMVIFGVNIRTLFEQFLSLSLNLRLSRV